MKSQKQKILDALKQARFLTPIDALNEFGCFRLGARIWELKKEIDPDTGQAYDIKMIPNDKGKRYAKYYLISPGVRRVF